MKIFTHKRWEGYYPVGVAAVIVANNVFEAQIYLEDKLHSMGLSQEVDVSLFVEINIDIPGCTILLDGDY